MTIIFNTITMTIIMTTISDAITFLKIKILILEPITFFIFSTITMTILFDFLVQMSYNDIY